ncbi:uncharacterized protein LOC143248135 [Tachypleus tridentatus]|uniref:uncharacterized protein LOC143248135 n=1 Tax=Tachypleus tridentatus TaxID=6853 RepID=UPI003FD4E7F9
MRNAQQKEPMISTPTPTLPWQYVSTDLFENQGTHYLVVVDHYSGYLEINEYEKEITSEQTVQKLKKLFATHGIPQIVYLDNGPQYDAKEFKDFSQIWDLNTKHSVPDIHKQMDWRDVQFRQRKDLL